MASVDVVVPCYKYGRYLRDCVQSVLAQQGVDVRVLIIDDCSPDNTPEVAQQLCDEDSRVEYRRHAENKGHIATYNEGLLGWASADACLLLSADDILAPGALARAAACLAVDPSISFVYGECIDFSDDALPSFSASTEIEFEFEQISGEDFIRSMCQTATNFVPTPTSIVRTSIQHQVGGYSPELPHAGDMEMWLRLAACGNVRSLKTVQACYRRHGSNMSTTSPFGSLPDIVQRYQAISAILRSHAHVFENVESLQQQAKKVLSQNALNSAHHAFDQADIAECKRLLRISSNLAPSSCRSTPYLKLMVKCLLGTSTWQALNRLGSACFSQRPSTNRT